jgi:hypothetical protein
MDTNLEFPEVVQEPTILFTVYIFIHPILTAAKLNFYREQFHNRNNIKNIVFVVSYDYCPFEKAEFARYNIEEMINIDIFRNQMFYNIGQPEINILDVINLGDEINNYDDFFINELILDFFDYNIYLLHCNPNSNINYTGIGCKRFFSQLYHNKIFNDTHYCAIDDLSVLYINTTNEEKSMENVTRDNLNGLLCYTYSDAITDMSNYIQNNLGDNLFLLGYHKPTEGNLKPNESINRTFSLYKFIYVHSEIIKNIYYDPFCSNFKEDVDWLNRVRFSFYDNVQAIKFSFITVCKQIPEKYCYQLQYDVNELNLVESQYIENVEYNNESFYNYIYFIFRHMNIALYNKPNGVIGKMRLHDESEYTFFTYVPQIDNNGGPDLGITSILGIEPYQKQGVYLYDDNEEDLSNGIDIYLNSNIISDRVLRCNIKTYNIKNVKMLFYTSKKLYEGLYDVGLNHEGFYNIQYYSNLELLNHMQENQIFNVLGNRRNPKFVLLESREIKIFREFVEKIFTVEKFWFKKGRGYFKLIEGKEVKPTKINDDIIYKKKYLKYKLKYLLLNKIKNNL